MAFDVATSRDDVISLPMVDDEDDCSIDSDSDQSSGSVAEEDQRILAENVEEASEGSKKQQIHEASPWLLSM